MKITFVYPDIFPHDLFWPGYYYAGIGSLAAFLKKLGFQTSLIHIIKPISKEEFISKIERENPDLIGFSATSHAFPWVEKLARWLVEEKVNRPTICGGIHPTLVPEAINTLGIDMICRGEGEEPLAELCHSLERGKSVRNILNIWHKKNGIIHKNPVRPLYQNLDILPFPDRKIFDYEHLFHERKGYASVILSRGCPYECSYCCNHALKELYGKKGGFTRFLGVEQAISEIRKIVEDFPFIRGIHFDDDILFLRESWGREFFSSYQREIALPFRCNARPNLLTESRVQILKEAGCAEIAIGLESGSDYIRNQILNRHLKHSQVKKAFNWCKEQGINIKSFNMVGIPYEDTRAILDTIKLNAELKVDEIQATIFRPYPRTKMFDLCLQEGFLSSDGLGADFFSPSVLQLDSISSEQILMFRDYFKILVKMYGFLQRLPKSISGILVKMMDKILSLKFTSKLLNKIYPSLNFLYRRVRPH